LNPTDEDLLRTSLASDPEAFAQLLARYERRVYGLLLRLCHGPQDAQDLFQIVWMQAFASRASFKHQSRFGTWLYAIAVNQVRTWQRKQIVQRQRRGQMPADPPDPRPSLLDRVLKRDQERRLHGALQKLSSSDQEILTLYYLQDLDYGEIAQITGKKLAPLRLQVHRALQRLRSQMERHEA
jgi:RNA polymerase sigma factor (sigma-70 family)